MEVFSHRDWYYHKFVALIKVNLFKFFLGFRYHKSQLKKSLG